jgi:SnoaL-like protein
MSRPAAGRMDADAARSADRAAAAVIDAAQLVLRERESRDLCWWQGARDCFHPDATVNVGWFHGPADEFVTGSARMAAAGGNTLHRLAPPVVHLGPGGNRAVVVLPATISSRATIDGVEADLNADVRIVYRVERRDGQWRIAHMDCIYGRDSLTAAVPGLNPAVPVQELTGLRPAYRMLAWSFARRGIPVRDDLLGDDRPHEVAAFFAAAFAWARLDDPAAPTHASDDGQGHSLDTYASPTAAPEAVAIRAGSWSGRPPPGA